MQWVRKRRRASAMVAGGGGGGSRRVRLGVFIALAGLLSGLVVAIAPSPASAGAIVPCPAGMTDWRRVGVWSRGFYEWEGYRYTLVSATPRFAVSEAQALDNRGSDAVANYTVTVERSQTHTVTAAVGVEVNPEKTLSFLKTTVNVTIQTSVTTKLGVSFSVSVPPRTLLTAEYGLDVFDVTYYVEAWHYPKPWGNPDDGTPPVGGTCEEWGFYPQSTVAPTVFETWRLRTST